MALLVYKIGCDQDGLMHAARCEYQKRDTPGRASTVPGLSGGRGRGSFLHHITAGTRSTKETGPLLSGQGNKGKRGLLVLVTGTCTWGRSSAVFNLSLKLFYPCCEREPVGRRRSLQYHRAQQR